MAKIKLLPSAHPSTWQADCTQISDELATPIFERDRHCCRFCSCFSLSGNQIYFLDSDRGNLNEDNLATACILCCAVQNLQRPEAELEVLPIWLPELAQRALNKMIRGIHILRVRNQLPAPADVSPRFDSPVARTTSAAFLTFAQRAVDLRKKTGVRSPAEFAELFLRSDPRSGQCPETLAVGLRFLHRGRYFVAGKDIYGELLKEDLESLRQSRAA
jgi:hypothetical protein